MYKKRCVLNKNRLQTVGVFFSAVFCLCSQATAASFDIKPIRIFLDEKVRLEKLIIKNVSDTKFPIQIKAYEWSQNQKGEDVYSETRDIITFPKILSIDKGQEKIIRIGTNVRPAKIEKTYRIYVEEMPVPDKDNSGTKIRLFMKVGIPVFINPVKIDNRPEIEDMEVVNGKLKVTVINKGNTHFVVTGVAVRGANDEGKELFARDIGGWYLLSGTQKIYETDIPPEACGAISNLRVVLKTSKATVEKNIIMAKDMCRLVDDIARGQNHLHLCRQVEMSYGY
ncbi:MAG: molecular chaperone [Deltaproteobacteria bacterium]|nr:molecular chaperone [Deltaproteobacteria bacterium]